MNYIKIILLLNLHVSFLHSTFEVASLQNQCLKVVNNNFSKKALNLLSQEIPNDLKNSIEAYGLQHPKLIQKIKCSERSIIRLGVYENFLIYISTETETEKENSYRYFFEKYDLINKRVIYHHSIPKNCAHVLKFHGRFLTVYGSIKANKYETLELDLIGSEYQRYINYDIYRSEKNNVIAHNRINNYLYYNNRFIKILCYGKIRGAHFDQYDYLFACVCHDSLNILSIVPTVSHYYTVNDKKISFTLGKHISIDVNHSIEQFGFSGFGINTFRGWHR